MNFTHADPAEAADQCDQVTASRESPVPKVARMMGEAKTNVLTFNAFPIAHWQQIWSTNRIEPQQGDQAPR